MVTIKEIQKGYISVSKYTLTHFDEEGCSEWHFDNVEQVVKFLSKRYLAQEETFKTMLIPQDGAELNVLEYIEFEVNNKYNDDESFSYTEQWRLHRNFW